MKVLVVGAGPAGLSCAEEILRNTNYDVIVVDRKRQVGEKPRCAGGVSQYMLDKAGVSIPSEAIIANIKRARIYSPNGSYWEMSGDKPYGYVLNRTTFEKALADRVERLGGKIFTNYHITEGLLSDLKRKYDYIVGADGFPSVVRKMLNLPNPSLEDIHFCVQKTIKLDYYPQDTVEVYFGSLAPGGYAWIFPAGKDHVRIGLGIPLSTGLSPAKLLEKFIERQTCDYEYFEYVAKLIPTAKPHFGNAKNVILVGDAGLFCDPLTGGGIIQAIASGRAAGKAIADGDLSRFPQYIEWLIRQNNSRYKLKRALLKFKDEDFNSLVEALKKFKPKSMSLGKEIRRAVLHLVVKKPRLLAKLL